MLSGCSHHQALNLSELKVSSKPLDFIYQEPSPTPFKIASFVKQSPNHKNNHVHIYIEGDGFAWKTPFTPSSNPTPRDDLTLKLAQQDSTETVIYLARPCQFTSHVEQSACNVEMWTSHRYSPETVQVMSQAIDMLLTQLNMLDRPKIVLFGYSGGGTIAALLTASRNDITGLVTIAANLDHTAWTNYHGDTPLHGSLNAISIAKDIQMIPQIHLVGDKDENVPIIITQNFIQQQTETKFSKLKIIETYNHHCCWQKHWPEHLKMISKEFTKMAN